MNKLIGNRIKQIRTSRKMSQEVLAAKCDMSISTVSRLERGDLMVSLEKLLNISSVLNVSIDKLLIDFISIDENATILLDKLNYYFSQLSSNEQDFFLFVLSYYIDTCKRF